MSSVILRAGATGTAAAAPDVDMHLRAVFEEAAAELDMERQMVEDRIDFPVPHLTERAPWTGAHAIRCTVLVEAVLVMALLGVRALGMTDPGAVLPMRARVLATVPAALALSGLIVLAMNAVVIPHRNARLGAVNERIDEHNARVLSDNRRLMAELPLIDARRARLDEWYEQCANGPAAPAIPAVRSR